MVHYFIVKWQLIKFHGQVITTASENCQIPTIDTVAPLQNLQHTFQTIPYNLTYPAPQPPPSAAAPALMTASPTAEAAAQAAQAATPQTAAGAAAAQPQLVQTNSLSTATDH